MHDVPQVSKREFGPQVRVPPEPDWVNVLSDLRHVLCRGSALWRWGAGCEVGPEWRSPRGKWFVYNRFFSKLYQNNSNANSGSPKYCKIITFPDWRIWHLQFRVFVVGHKQLNCNLFGWCISQNNIENNLAHVKWKLFLVGGGMLYVSWLGFAARLSRLSASRVITKQNSSPNSGGESNSNRNPGSPKYCCTQFNV